MSLSKTNPESRSTEVPAQGTPDADVVVPTMIQVGSKIIRLSPKVVEMQKSAAKMQRRNAKTLEAARRAIDFKRNILLVQPGMRPHSGRRRLAHTSRPLGHSRRRGTNLRSRGSARTSPSRSSGGGSSGEPSEPEPGEPSRLTKWVAHV